MVSLPHFGFFDWLLILCVSVFGTFSSKVRDPQIKAVFATVPVPFSLVWLAVGLPVASSNVAGSFLILAYVHGVRILHDRAHVPIIPSIAFGIALYAGIGALLAHRIPDNLSVFLFLSALSLLSGALILVFQNYRSGVFYRTPLPPLPKFVSIFCVVTGLVWIKGLLVGFAPFFPLMNSVISYEARHSLPTQCRQIPVFMVAASPMLVWMRFAECSWNWPRGWVLATGVTLYMLVFLPLNAKVRKLGMKNQTPTPNAPSGC
ncbi:MAG TPA: hypothetical protein VLM37_06695 [Fibrobacteraceae bacterium]|nr:hypothetical protein [Fibrobacteraceae bacterium]